MSELNSRTCSLVFLLVMRCLVNISNLCCTSSSVWIWNSGSCVMNQATVCWSINDEPHLRRKCCLPLSQNLLEVPSEYPLHASGTASGVNSTVYKHSMYPRSLSFRFNLLMKVNQCSCNLYQSANSPEKVIRQIHHSSTSDTSLFKHH